MTGNREYKSDVFSMLLENPQNALDLYNAVNNSEYTDSNLVEMCALDKGISLTCTVYNINYGKNRELLEKCTFLKEYMIFVDYVRENHRIYGYDNLEHSIETAIDRCIEENVLREFLIKRRVEVVKMMTLDYTFDRQITLEREDSRAEGREEGLEEGRAEGFELGREDGRREGEMMGIIKCYKRLGKTREDTAGYLMEELGLTQGEAMEYVERSW